MICIHVMSTERFHVSRRTLLRGVLETAKFAMLPKLESENKRQKILGLYLPFHLLPRKDRMDAFKRLVLTCGANTIVVDVKNEAGLTHVQFTHRLKPKWQSTIYPESPKELEKLILWARKNNVTLIGRQAIMPDARLLRVHPELGIKNKQGELWKDAHGQPWADAFKPEVALYNTAIAEATANAGILHVNYDYVRRPSDDSPTEQIVHSKANIYDNRTNAISTILLSAKIAVNKAGGILSADVLGYSAWREQKDLGVGQDIDRLAHSSRCDLSNGLS